MTKPVIIIFLFALSFSSVSQQNLKYFDREMVVKHNIHTIYEMISFNVHTNMRRESVFNIIPNSIRRKGMPIFEFINADVGTPWRACRNDHYVFDKRGNILYAKKKGKEVRFFYEYNQENEMINYYLGDYYPFGTMIKIQNFKECLRGDKELFQKNLTNYQEPFDLQLSSKIDYTQGHFYNIRSTCSGISAKYKITVAEEKDGLPILLRGQFVEYLKYNSPGSVRLISRRDVDSRKPDHVGSKYNEDIYIYYYYEYFE